VGGSKVVVATAQFPPFATTIEKVRRGGGSNSMCSASTSHSLAIGTLHDGCMGELTPQQQGEPLLRTQAPGGAVIRSKYRGLSWDKKHQGWVLVRRHRNKRSSSSISTCTRGPELLPKRVCLYVLLQVACPDILQRQAASCWCVFKDSSHSHMTPTSLVRHSS
jgi:hypothetical protein